MVWLSLQKRPVRVTPSRICLSHHLVGLTRPNLGHNFIIITRPRLSATNHVTKYMNDQILPWMNFNDPKTEVNLLLLEQLACFLLIFSRDFQSDTKKDGKRIVSPPPSSYRMEAGWGCRGRPIVHIKKNWALSPATFTAAPFFALNVHKSLVGTGDRVRTL